MRKISVAGLVVACVLSTVTPAASYHDRYSPVRTTLPFNHVADLVFTPGNQHTYITGGRGTTQIFEVDRDSRRVRTGGGLAGPGDLVVEKDRLWASQHDGVAIAELARPSLRVIEHHSTAPYEELGDISKTGDTIYFSYGCWSSTAERGLASVDLDTGIVRDHGHQVDRYCPGHDFAPTDDEVLVTWTPLEDVLRIYRHTPAGPLLLDEAQFDRLYDVDLSGGFAFVLEQRQLSKVDLTTLSTVATHAVPEGTTRVTVDPVGEFVAVIGSNYSTTVIYDTSDLRPVRRLHYAGQAGSHIALFKGGRKAIYSRGSDAGSGTLLHVQYDRERVRATRATELAPAAGSGYVAWADSRPKRRGRLNVYVKRGEARPRRVNPRGTEAWSGAIDGRNLIYTQGRSRQWNIKLYDLKTKRRKSVPGRINTRAREWRPSLSGRWILFSRAAGKGYTGGRVLLYDRRKDRMRTLQRGPRRALLFADQVNGRWATWTVCARNCSVYRYDLKTRRKTKLPNRWENQFGASVTENGTLYYGVSRAGCGGGAGIVRHPRGKRPLLIARVWEGHDIDRTYVEPNRAGPPRVYYTEYSCSEFNPDIYFLEDP